ncbi:hypothetical protein [Streptomyces sp. NPDC093149]|uniref:hypothetical protein n=1 Tax=Streptomyces sp. NPDC093149 TaxID=3366031 RepID=UPI003806F7D0
MILSFFSSRGWEPWDVEHRPLIPEGMPVLVDDSAPSTASLRADNANLAERNRRLQQHIHLLEERLSVLLGEQAHQRSGLGAPPVTAALERELEDTRQQNLDMRRTLEEREEELGAVREAYRRLMADRNRGTPR